MDISNHKREKRRIRELKEPGSSRNNVKFKLTPVRRTRNRITSEINSKSQGESKTGNSIKSNNATCSSGYTNNSSFQGSQIVNIKLYYYINNEQKFIDIMITEDRTINELIHFSLNLINEQLISDKINIQLDKSNYNNYCIKLINKDEEYNENVPEMNLNMPIINCNLESKFFLIWLDHDNSNVISYQNKKN